MNESNKINKLYKFIAVSYLFILVTFATLTHLGLLDLKLYDRIETGTGLNNFIKFIFYSINMYFFMLIICRSWERKYITYFLIYTLVTVPFFFTSVNFDFFISFLSPFIFIGGLLGFKILKISEKLLFKDLLLSLLTYFVLTSIVQLLIGYIRLDTIMIRDLQNPNVKHFCVIMLDLLIYNYVYFKVVTANVRSTTRGMVSIFHAQTVSVSETCNNFQEILNLKSLKLRQKAIFAFLMYGYQFFTLFVVLAIGKINNKLLELVIMLLVFWIGRKILGKSWHSDDLWTCSSVTFVSFYILTLFPFVDFRISLFSGVSLSGIFVFMLYKLAEFDEKFQEMKRSHEKLYKFDLMTCSKEEILERCRLCGLNRDDTNVVIDIFYYKISTYDLSEKLHITPSSLRNKKTKLKKKLTIV